VNLTLGTDASVGILGSEVSTTSTASRQSSPTPERPGHRRGKALDQTATSLRLILDALGSIGGKLVSNPTRRRRLQGPIGSLVTSALSCPTTDRPS